MARAGCTYKFVPVLMDRNIAPSGTIVRVVPASGLGVSGRLPSKFAYIETLDGNVLGMCCQTSLTPRRAKSAMAQAAEACGLMRGSNLGMSKAMALDTLGNAYLYLREQFAAAANPFASGDCKALVDAADILHTAFDMTKAQLELLDFTITGGK